jgi:membrane protease YdiL (CAAX protease family)
MTTLVSEGAASGSTRSGYERSIAAAVALAVVALSVAAAYAGAHAFTRMLKLIHAPTAGSLAETGLAVTGDLAGLLIQLAVFFRAIRWLAGRDVLVWLVAPTHALGPRTFLAVIGAMFLIKVLAVFATGLLLSPSKGGDIVQSLTPVVDIMKTPLWVVFLACGLIGAVAEELIYRGYLSRILEDSCGFWAGAVVSALVWAAMHVYYPLSGQASLVVIGIGLSWMRMRTGSVYPGLAWHAANNALALIVMRAMG